MRRSAQNQTAPFRHLCIGHFAVVDTLHLLFGLALFGMVMLHRFTGDCIDRSVRKRVVVALYFAKSFDFALVFVSLQRGITPFIGSAGTAFTR